MPLTSLDLAGATLGVGEATGSRQRLTLLGATMLHGTLAAGLLLIPILRDAELPEAPGSHALLVALPELAPPPPPPPAPASAPRPRSPAPGPSARTRELVAPVDVPDRIAEGPEIPELEGGVAGGSEAGVEGGVEGGLVGGLLDSPAPAPTVVRVGGLVHEPRVVRDVSPVYPPVALAAHLDGLVILELEVGRDGVVREVRVMRAEPVFTEAAVEAARQRRYQPLLLDGVPTDFLVTVTIRFSLRRPHS
jgi:protein TonB